MVEYQLVELQDKGSNPLVSKNVAQLVEYCFWVAVVVGSSPAILSR